MDGTGSRIWAALAAMALLLSLTGCADDPPTQGAQSSASQESTADTPVQQEPAEDYAIDECLVGIWTTVSQREEATVNGEPVVLIDVERQLSFAADGVEAVTYLGTPAAVQSPTGEVLGQVVHTGELTYQVSTEEPGAITFEFVGGQVSAAFVLRGISSTLTYAGGSEPVTYTCSDTEHTQNSAGYQAVFTRAT